MQENPIFSTVQALGSNLDALVFIGLILIQYFKEVWKIEDKKAEILSLVVGFIMAAAVSLVYAETFAYSLSIGQWVGVGLFVAVGTVSPSGGYKFLGALLGDRVVD